VTITDSRHLRTELDEQLLHHVTASPTAVGQSCWIGAHAVVLDGVTVGDGAFVGGGSVVTRDVPSFWLAAGNPARAVRDLRLDAET
jgi:acetyltransferase-like isoleucine patch superfamily enzyme